jgi:16S rRNA (guanine966-N2)-methyltransferase
MADAGRVISGSAAGRRLAAPGPGTRPLADRVKQTVFAILDPDLAGSAVLDLFAGSGAAGIEALSRGAAVATFVERDARAVAVIRENLDRTGLRRVSAAAGETAAAAGGRTGAGQLPAIVVAAEVMAWLRGPGRAAGPFDIVIVDPPYADRDVLAGALTLLAEDGSGLLAPGARVVAKHFWRDAPPTRIGLLASDRSRRFGETAVTFYRFAEPGAGPESRGVS